MEKKTDALLRKLIKNWANRYKPPDNGRARLLWVATCASHSKADPDAFVYRTQYNSYPFSYANEWAQQLFHWINQNSFQVSLKARLI